MKPAPLNIKFNNRQSPESEFDLLKLEELFSRKDLDHSIDKLHLVEFYLLMLVTEGSGKHTIDFTEYTCQQGSVLTIRKDQLHKFHLAPSIKGYLFLFTDEFLASYFAKTESQQIIQLFNELLGLPKIQLSKEVAKAAFAIAKRIETEYFLRQDEYALGIIRSELQILISRLFRAKKQGKQVIANRKYLGEFIQLQSLVENGVTREAKVSFYAKEMGFSTKTLNAITQSILQKTAKAFIDEIYIKQIKRILLNTDDSVKEIAYQTGFEEPSNFYKFFKRLTGSTPEKFRHSNR